MARKRLDREQVLAAAVRLVDAHGLEGLSMRRLGEALGVEAMSLYRHVANKADLLDGIQSAILAEMVVPPLEGPWLEQLGALVRAFRAVLRAHPAALPIFATRPAVAPGSLAAVNRCLAVLAAAGFPEREQAAIFQALLSYVVGSAFVQFAPEAGGEPDPVDYGALPDALAHVRRVGPSLHALDEDEEFELGLDLLLGGLARRRP